MVKVKNDNIQLGLVIAIVAIVSLVIGIALGGLFNQTSFGGLVHNVQETFDEGIAVDGTEVIDGSGYFVGAVNGTTGAFSSTLEVTGAATLSSTLSAVAATFTGLTKVNETASSTIQIGSTASGVGTGCLILGDSGGATSTPVYITATGSTITATTTTPDICQ
jgi:hypothetical protein